MKKVFEDDTVTIYEEGGALRVVLKRDEEGYFRQISREAKEFIKNWKG